MARTAVVKRGRGRPRKHPVVEAVKSVLDVKEVNGRPKRTPVPRETVEITQATPVTQKRVQQLVDDIRKQFGPDSIGLLGDYESSIETFPSGSAALDAAIGVGGFPLARLVQITGGEAVGKSTTTNYLAAQAQRHGIIVYFLDGEMSEGVDRATAIGVNTSLLPISEPLTLEDAFMKMECGIKRMSKWSDPSLVILDSVAALPMQSDLDRPFDEEGRRAARASFLSANLGKLVHSLKGTKVGLIFVNQLREKANAMPFEKPTYSPGGRALRHWCHLTLELKKLGQIKVAQQVVGITTRIRVEKSKLAPPFKIADINLLFDGTVQDAPERRGEVHEG
jgi:recombination protein RecA